MRSDTCGFWLVLCMISHRHTHRHTAHAGTNRLTHPFKYILTTPAMYSQQLYVIHWIIHYQKFTFHNVFSFQKLLTCRNQKVFPTLPLARLQKRTLSKREGGGHQIGRPPPYIYPIDVSFGLKTFKENRFTPFFTKNLNLPY